jgi:hypothetical protein
VAALSVGAAALALLATGAGLYFSALADYDRLKGDCGSGCAPSTWQDARLRADVGYGFLAAGAAAAVVDGVLWGWRARHGRDARAWIAPIAGPGIAVGGRF